MVKIALTSDVHRGTKPGRYPWTHGWPKEAEVVIIAGDIESLPFLKEEAVKYPDKLFIVVLGNHDFWNRPLGDKTVKRWKKKLAPYANIQVLERDVLHYEDVVFLGTTLWCNPKPAHWYDVEQGINCFDEIRTTNGRKGITCSHLIEEHKRMKAWLIEELEANKDKKVVVVTHVPPMSILCDEERRMDPVSDYYHGGMDLEMMQWQDESIFPAVWCFGHTHERVSRVMGPTRFESNAFGYPFGPDKNRVSEFDPELIIEV